MRGHHTIALWCNTCGHTGEVRDQDVVKRSLETDGPMFRCSKCGAREGIDVRFSFSLPKPQK